MKFKSFYAHAIRVRQQGGTLNKTGVVFYSLAFFTLLTVLNGCRDKIDVNSTLSSKFSQIEKQYFIETAFGNDKNVKWDKPMLTYSIEGAFDDNQKLFINETIAHLTSIKNLPEFCCVKNCGDISFNMSSSVADFDKSYRNGIDKRGVMLMNVTLFGGRIKSTRIIVKPKQSKSYTLITIQHELMHALGLGNHPITKFRVSSALGIRYFDSLDASISASIPKIDSAALVLLYDKRIPIKSNKNDIIKLIGVDND